MGEEPVAFDVQRPPEGWLPDGVPFVQGSMANLEDVVSVMVDQKVQRVVVLGYIMAALTAPQYRDYIGAVKTNVLGVTNVFEAARLTGVDRVVFASSAGVYGPQSTYGERPVTEDDPVAPAGLYGTMKYANEALAQQYSRVYDLQVVRVRPPGILGAGNTMWPSRVITPPALGRAAMVNFPSQRHQNAIPVEDLAALYSRLALAPSLRHDLYLAHGHAFVSAEVAAIIRSFIPDAQIEFNDSVTPLEGGFPYLYDDSRLNEEFDVKLRPLEAAVRSHIDHERAAAGLEPL
jgi:nucleoside-diphosphate-sugar epimerase